MSGAFRGRHFLRVNDRVLTLTEPLHHEESGADTRKEKRKIIIIISPETEEFSGFYGRSKPDYRGTIKLEPL